MLQRPFTKYPNKVFIETGTADGSSVKLALDAGFSQIYSIELNDNFHQIAQKRFSENKNVTLIKGNSATELSKVLEKVDCPATIFLDAHYCGGHSVYSAIEGPPLIHELMQIARHPLADKHTIIVNDRRMMKKTGKKGLDTYLEVTEYEIHAYLKIINPKTIITFENGHIPDDIIVSSPTKVEKAIVKKSNEFSGPKGPPSPYFGLL